MKAAQIIIFCFVCLGVFFAFYLRKPPAIEKVAKEPEEVIMPIKVPKQHQLTRATFTVSVDHGKSFNVGILGESRGDEAKDEMVNKDVLSQLLKALKDQKVKAVFFTGNLVSGVENDPENPDTPKKLDAKKLADQLKIFGGLYHSILGDTVPLFPAIGDREIAIPGAEQAFLNAFSLTGATLIGGDLAYTVSVGSAFFAVIATQEFSPDFDSSEQAFNYELLDWLNKVLADASSTHRYRFVIGHEPAFPSSSTYTLKNQKQRDAFWKVLVDNGVLAYFASREHLYDRSNRFGVWQIISGGAGAPLNEGGGSNPFFHCLLLNIPAEKDALPKVQVYDVLGQVIDEFELKASQVPLYQMRISAL